VRVEKDNDFWENKMLPFLTRFYFDCMLPKILDSRHNRHMPIREPQYIIEAKEKLSRSVNNCNTMGQHIKTASVNKQENKTIANKGLPYNISIETSGVVPTAEIEQDDCIIISHVTNYIPTAHEIASRKRILDDREISLSSVKDNVLPKNNKLNDDSLDLFLRVVKTTSSFETQSVHYIEFPQLITAICKKSVQIIGGNCTDHWRCIFFNGIKLYVYDSISGYTYDKMASKKKEYISACFPQLMPTDISFEKVQTQPDSTACGIYAAAFATDVEILAMKHIPMTFNV